MEMGACLVQFPLDGSFEERAGPWETVALTTCSPQPCLKRTQLLQGLGAAWGPRISVLIPAVFT